MTRFLVVEADGGSRGNPGTAAYGAAAFDKTLRRRAVFSDHSLVTDAVFAEILEELSNQYLLGYVPHDLARDGRWRALRVEVPGKDVRVRARQGYRAVAR